MRFSDHRLLAQVAGSTGLVRLLERFCRRRGLLVLNYHRIGTPSDQLFDDATFSATAANFRKQMTALRRLFSLPRIGAVLATLESGTLSTPTAVVTFDDGYRDNYDLALPILRELDIPACFFVATAYMDEPTLPWWDAVAYLVKRTTVPVLTLEYPAPMRFDMTATPRDRVTWRILRAYKDASSVDPDRFIDRLVRATGVELDRRKLGSTLFMTWDQVRGLHQAGMTVGSHTVSHPVLAQLSEEEQRRELVESRVRIAEQVGAAPEILAYPVGGPSAFTETTKRLAREAGYRAAFSYFGGVNLPGRADPFALARVEVEHRDTLAQFQLRLALCGAGLEA